MMLKCRFCGAPVNASIVDLGMSPLANSYVPMDSADKGETYYPLHAYVCEQCFLVQLEAFETPESIFSDYAYFSSYSEGWLAHCQKYAENVISRYHIDEQSLVVEIASNDGYLLQFFQEKGLNVLGIEPAANVAQVAIAKGIPTMAAFFGQSLASELIQQDKSANLLIANNVLAHVPDLNDFVVGMKMLLAEKGVITAEFPHLLNLLRENQFDTIYHEHFSYFSLYTIQQIFTAHGLIIFDVEVLPTHGGSIRIHACHQGDKGRGIENHVAQLLADEQAAGLLDVHTYVKFHEQVKKTKREILGYLLQLKETGAHIAAYGAPAKGNTLLNYCGIGTDIIDFAVDRNPHKQHTFLPGSHIPVWPLEKLLETRPEYIVILPWNLKEEIVHQLGEFCDWDVKLITLIPKVEMVSCQGN